MKIVLAPLTLSAFVINKSNAFVAHQRTAGHDVSLTMSLEKYSDELVETANTLVRSGRGLLACDESTGTVGSRLESIGMKNIEENRRDVSFSSSLYFYLDNSIICTS
jgi:hypothetical protein